MGRKYIIVFYSNNFIRIKWHQVTIQIETMKTRIRHYRLQIKFTIGKGIQILRIMFNLAIY